MPIKKRKPSYVTKSGNRAWLAPADFVMPDKAKKDHAKKKPAAKKAAKKS